MKFCLKFKSCFHSRKCRWRFRLQNSGHFVSDPIMLTITCHQNTTKTTTIIQYFFKTILPGNFQRFSHNFRTKCFVSLQIFHSSNWHFQGFRRASSWDLNRTGCHSRRRSCLSIWRNWVTLRIWWERYTFSLSFDIAKHVQHLIRVTS